MRFIIISKMTEAYQRFIKKLIPFLPISINTNLIDFPFETTPIYGSMDLEYIEYVLPGMTMTIIFIIAMALTSLTFVIEKKEGLLDRSMVAGVNVVDLMIAHFTVKLIILIVQSTIVLLMIVFMLGLNIGVSFFTASLLMLLQGVCGMSLGIFLLSII